MFTMFVSSIHNFIVVKKKTSKNSKCVSYFVILYSEMILIIRPPSDPLKRSGRYSIGAFVLDYISVQISYRSRNIERLKDS